MSLELRYAQLSIIDVFLHSDCGKEAHKKLINYCKILIIVDLHLWIKFVQFDSKAVNIGV